MATSKKGINKMKDFTQQQIDFILNKYDKKVALRHLKIMERQKYHYYCDCSDFWSTEQCENYNKEWDLILVAIEKLERELETYKDCELENDY